MNKIKKIVFAICLMVLATLNVNALTIQETSENYDGDVYVFGSTKFDGNTIVTLSSAGLAGMNEAKVQLALYGAIDTENVKTYYFSDLTRNWSEITIETGKLRLLSDAETDVLEKNLKIFYVNNIEKIIEIPFSGIIDENSITPNSPYTENKAIVENGKIKVPATWIGGFSFTSNSTLVDVKLSTINNDGTFEEVKVPVLKKEAELSLSNKKESYVSFDTEFTFKIIANDLKGESITDAKITITDPNSKELTNIEYYDEENSVWTSDLSKVLGKTIEDKTITLRFQTEEIGKHKIQIKTNFGVIESEFESTVNPNAIAKIGNKYYENLAILASNAKDGDTVEIIKDTTVTERVKFASTVTLNLNGKTITLTDTNRIQSVKTGNLTVKNGNIKGNSYALQAEDNAKLKVEKDVYISLENEKNTNLYGITIWDNAEVTFKGKIKIKGDGYGISGNGGEASNTKLTVSGIIEAKEGAALFLPQTGVTDIIGGEYTGNTVIGIKSGTLNIIDGKFTALGEKVEPKSKNSGFYYTGDVVFVEENKSYKDNIKINITGGTLTSTNGYIIQEYNPTIGTENELSLTMSGLYTTKNFGEKENSFYYTDEETAAFTADGIKYGTSSFRAGVANAKNVVILKDFTLNNYGIFEGEATLDLNGKTLEVGSYLIAPIGSANLTIKNGKIKAVSTAIQVQDNATLTVDKDVNIEVGASNSTNIYGITIYDECVVNFNGNIVINGEGHGISSSDTYGKNTTLNINGNITSLKGAALYLPQVGTTNINGGILKADTVIGIKAGTLNILAGELIAVGNKVAPVADNNGFEYTGDVVFVEENKSYKDNIKINITGGTLTSTNGYIIQEYNPAIGTENELSLTMSGLYTTKNYGETKNSFYYTDEEAAFTIDGVKYAESSLESALKDSKEIKLLKNITLKNTIILTSGNPVVDLNEKTLSMKSTVSTSMFIVKNVSNDLSLTLKNGKIVAQSDKYIYVVKSGYSDFDNKISGNKKVVTTLDGVKITTNDCGVFVQGSNSVLNVINSEINAGYQAILANGSKGYGTVGSEINVTNSVLTGKDLAIFHPQNGTLNIKGSTLTGPTAIGIKSGILNIENSSINATAKEYTQGQPTGDGIYSTGDAILVEVRKGYQDVNDTTSKIEVSIAKDVTFTTGTSNTYALRVLNPYTDLTPKLGVKLTGLTLNNEASVENEYVFTK